MAEKEEFEEIMATGRRHPGVQEAIEAYKRSRDVIAKVRRSAPRSAARRGFASNRSQ